MALEPIKFSEVTDGGTVLGTDELVGLRGGDNIRVDGIASETYVQNQILANKYADRWKDPVQVIAVTALPANTYDNGTSGVGATITANANGALSIDGYAPAAGERVAVAGDGLKNGIFVVTQTGSGSAPFILTRALDADSSAELVSCVFKTIRGTTYPDTQWICTNNSITFGSTSIVLQQDSGDSAGLSAFYNVKEAPYFAAGDGTTNDRAAIQAALDAAYAAGGGIVFMPAGTYGVLGTGTASDGCLQVKDNVTLCGAGRGATIIKLLDSNSSDVTGIVRTPTGVPTRNCTFHDFTIDGNMANNTDRIIGFYLGVKPSHRCKLSVVGTTATATTYEDDGTTLRAHGLSSGTKYIHSEDPRTTGDFVITVTGTNTFTFTVASGTPSDSVGYTWYYDDAYASIADEDILIYNMEIKQCQAYAFDPHERVNRMTMYACVAHDNGPDGDGFTLDHIHDSSVTDCYAHDNQRNGFNVVTGSQNVTISNCHSHNNSQYGFASQRGSTTIPRNRGIKFLGCSASGNGQHGLRLQMGIDHTVQGCRFFQNSRNGISVEGCLNSQIVHNLCRDNGQGSTNTYDEIIVKQYTFSADSVIYASQYNRIDKNTVNASLTVKARYLLREDNDASDYNVWSQNTLVTAGASGSASISVGNPNTVYITDADIASGGGGGTSTSGRYISTMATTNDAATNAALFAADVAAASAARLTLYIPPGEYSIGYTNGTPLTITLSASGTNFVRIRGEGDLTVLKNPAGNYLSYMDFTALASAVDYTVSAFSTVTSGAELATTSEVTSVTITGGPASIAKHEHVSIWSDDLLPQYESTSERNYIHQVSEVYNYNSGTGVVLLGRKLPRTQTTGYCRLRRYNNDNIIFDIDDIAFEADGDVYDTALGNGDRPQYVFRIAGLRDAKVGKNVTINSAWAGGPCFNSTLGCRYSATTRKMLNGVTGQVVLGYGPVADGPNLGLEIEGAKTYGGRHTPTTTFGEAGILTVTGLSVAGATTTLTYANAAATPAIGDRIEFSGIVGTLSALNGTKQTITSRTGSAASGTISFAFDSTGLAYSSGGTGNIFQPDIAHRQGECEGMIVQNAHVTFGNGSCYDSHANALSTLYRNCTARWVYTLTPGSVAPTVFSSRGANECIDGMYAERCTRFANIISQQLNYGMDNITTLNNCHVHDQQDKAAAVALIVGYGASTATDYRLTDVNDMKITGGAYRIGTWPAYSSDVRFNNFRFEGDWGISPTATQYMFDYAVAGGRWSMRNSIIDLSRVTTNTEVRMMNVTGAGAIVEFNNVHFRDLNQVSNYAIIVSGAAAKVRFVNCTFEFDAGATDNTLRFLQVNNVAATVEFVRCRTLNSAKLATARGLVFSTGVSANATVKVNDLEKDGTIAIVGTSSTAGSFTIDEIVAVHNSRALAQTAAFTMSVPANNGIDAMYIKGNNANAITGGLKVGTTLGGTDVISAQTVGANALLKVADADLLKKIFSSGSAQTLYFDAVSSWNSANIDVTIKYSEI